MNDSQVPKLHLSMWLFAALVGVQVVPAGQANGELYAIKSLGPSEYEPHNPFINDRGQTAVFLQSISSPGIYRYEFFNGTSSLDMRPRFPMGAALNHQGEFLGLVSSAQPDRFDLKLFREDSESVVGSIERQRDSAAIADSNDVGQFVGNHYSANFSDTTVFVGTIGGTSTSIADLGGNHALATDINNHGHVVGVSQTGATHNEVLAGAAVEEAFLYQDGVIHALGTIAGAFSFAHAINDLGQVVGESSTAEQRGHAFLYDPILGMKDIGRPGMLSFALDINNRSQVVGVENSRAFLYDAVDGVRLLDDFIPANSGWTSLQQATSINIHGQIVGIGVLNGQARAFLLTPVPEPTSLVVLLAATTTSIAAVRRRVR